MRIDRCSRRALLRASGVAVALPFLESLLRVADWRASAQERQGGEVR